MWKIISLTRTADQAQEEDSHPEKGEEEVDPRESRITTQETSTSIVNIMEEDTTPKGAQKPRRTSQEFSKKKLCEHRILNAVPDSPEFLAAQFMNS
jgi:hypothetical protein